MFDNYLHADGSLMKVQKVGNAMAVCKTRVLAREVDMGSQNERSFVGTGK